MNQRLIKVFGDSDNDKKPYVRLFLEKNKYTIHRHDEPGSGGWYKFSEGDTLFKKCLALLCSETIYKYMIAGPIDETNEPILNEFCEILYNNRHILDFFKAWSIININCNMYNIIKSQ